MSPYILGYWHRVSDRSFHQVVNVWVVGSVVTESMAVGIDALTVMRGAMAVFRYGMKGEV